MKVSIISFSGRKNGNCAAIGRYLQELYGEEAKLYSFSDFNISPCGNCDQDCMNKGDCPYTEDMEFTLLNEISESDRSYFIVPNYSDYPCANFFAFNERSLAWFWGNEGRLKTYSKAVKKFIVVSNDTSANFAKVFSYHVESEPQVLFLGSRSFGKNIMESPKAKALIQDFSIK